MRPIRLFANDEEAKSRMHNTLADEVRS